MRKCIDEGTLQAWFDGELAADKAASVAAHLNGCFQCAEKARSVDSENLVVSEGLANEFAGAIPTERLRQRVETAVTAFHKASMPTVRQSRAHGPLGFFASFRPLAYVSIAAAILLAGFLGFVYLKKDRAAPGTARNDSPSVRTAISKEPIEQPDMRPSSVPRKSKTVRSKTVSRSQAYEADARSLSWQERQYDYAISKLNEAIKVQPPLRPSLQVEYEYNMAVINNEIETSRDVARRNPNDPQAAQLVLTAYQSKVDLMNQIANTRMPEK